MAERQTQLTADQLYPGSIPGLGFLGTKVSVRKKVVKGNEICRAVWYKCSE